MDNMQSKLLMADDEQEMHRLVDLALTRGPWKEKIRIAHATTVDEAKRLAQQSAFHLALVDLHFHGDGDAGFGLIEFLKASDPSLEIVAFSSAGSFSAVQRAVRAGAGDYVQKGFSPDELYHALERALERRRLKRMERNVVREHRKAGEFVGSSVTMNSLREFVSRFSQKEAPVLIEGETGSGKELVAKALHSLSPRCGGPFVAVDCGAVPSSTADSFFFGHERGAFTGAEKTRIGALEEADGGTLFLDEVNSLSLDLQSKLLRALQEREIRRLGGNKSINLDFRLVAATNASLEQMVKEGRFREDLFYRLQVLLVKVPPLRDRLDDLEELARFFLPNRIITPELWRMFRNHAWPGNVREFRNCLAAIDALAEPGESLKPEHLPEHALAKFASSIPAQEAAGAEDFYGAQEQREVEFLSRAYRGAGGNVSRLARMLEMDRSHLHQKLVKLGIHLPKK